MQQWTRFFLFLTVLYSTTALSSNDETDPLLGNQEGQTYSTLSSDEEAGIPEALWETNDPTCIQTIAMLTGINSPYIASAITDFIVGFVNIIPTLDAGIKNWGRQSDYLKDIIELQLLAHAADTASVGAEFSHSSDEQPFTKMALLANIFGMTMNLFESYLTLYPEVANISKAEVNDNALNQYSQIIILAHLAKKVFSTGLYSYPYFSSLMTWLFCGPQQQESDAI